MIRSGDVTDDELAQLTMARRQHIKQIIVRCSDCDSQLITDSSLLAMDLYIDSLILTDIVYEAESAFSIAITESEMAIVEDVTDFYRLVESKLARTES